MVKTTLGEGYSELQEEGDTDCINMVLASVVLLETLTAVPC